MKRFIEGASRSQSTLFPEYLEDWVGDDNPVRVIDVFVEELDLGDLGFERVARPAAPTSSIGRCQASISVPKIPMPSADGGTSTTTGPSLIGLLLVLWLNF